MKASISYVPEVDNDLKSFTDKKIESIRKNYITLISLDIKFITDHDNNEKIVKIEAHVPGQKFFIHKNTKTFEKSMNNAFNTLGRKLKKEKEKQIG